MCTVTYVPLKGYDFILTSNRDEAITRTEVAFPSKSLIATHQTVFPKDGKAGGTWIATSKKLTVCLLNGAFVKHQSTPPYRMSRGKMLLAAFEYEDFETFKSSFDFKGIEPFTLVLVYRSNSEVLLYEMRWDGVKLYSKELYSHKPYIWASATLYSDDVIKERKQLFANFYESFGYTQQEIIAFHQFENGDKENAILMDRGDKKTISVTSISSLQEGVTITYNDLIQSTTLSEKVAHEAEKV